MNLYINSVVTNIVLFGGWNGAYRIANELKWNYYKKIGRAFPVSTKSAAIEIIGHVIPDSLSKVIGIIPTNYTLSLALNAVGMWIRTKTYRIDIGTTEGGDGNRKYWDALAGMTPWLKSTY